MSKVKFQFDDSLPHQAKAIESTVNLFSGCFREYHSRSDQAQTEFFELRNKEINFGTRLEQKLQKTQLENQLFQDEKLLGKSFGIEMETGTGKTYVYLRTILELYKKYQTNDNSKSGLKKFIIVVPSVAIRKGIEKSIEQLTEHFKRLDYADLSKHSFVYTSKNLSRMKSFVENIDLDICIINTQAFNSDNTLLQKPMEQGGVVLWDKIREIKPIVIIDEPQKVEGTLKTPSQSRNQLDELQPLFELKYSATHRKEFPMNMLYSLDSYQAYEQSLVKRIRVKTVYGQIPKDQPYVRYVKFNKNLTAQVEIFTQAQGGKIKTVKHAVEAHADLYDLSGELSQYEGYRIPEQPHKQYDLKVQTPHGELALAEGASNMEMAQDEAKRIQIRLAIEAHFEKLWELLDAGLDVKPITLFFVDEVAKVRDVTQPDGRGLYLRIFDEEYKQYIGKEETQFKLAEYSYLFPKDISAEDVREGYFSQDKAGKITEPEYGKKDSGKLLKKSQEDVDRGIELILEKKDELISFKEPLAFIFSHSALREGWDNPNVFTLCTLRNSNSEIAKKQEIGRGLRLPVDINGERVLNDQHNVLTVIANDHYDHFADTLQKDFNEENGFNKDEVTQTLLQNTLVNAGVPKEKITPELVNVLKTELTRKGVIDKKKGTLTPKAQEELEKITFGEDTLNEHTINIKKQFKELMEKRGTRKVKVENGDVDPIHNAKCSYVSERGFQVILKKLISHLTKRSLYNYELDSDQFITHATRKLNEYFCNQNVEMVTKIETGEVGFDDTGKVITIQGDTPVKENKSAYNEMPEEFKKTDLQIADYIMYHTMMPRMAILRIVQNFFHRELLNSQDKLEGFTKQLRDLLTAAKSKNVRGYEIIKGYELETSQILEAEVIDPEQLDKEMKVYQAKQENKKAVHEYYNMDSKGEYSFAQELDHDENVVLFTKLKKGGFVIDTPRGNYSPDWAIVYKDGEGSSKLYFIVETKADKQEEHLSGVEKEKIECGKLHFQAISEEIKYDWVNSYQDFKRKVQAETFGE